MSSTANGRWSDSTPASSTSWPLPAHPRQATWSTQCDPADLEAPEARPPRVEVAAEHERRALRPGQRDRPRPGTSSSRRAGGPGARAWRLTTQVPSPSTAPWTTRRSGRRVSTAWAWPESGTRARIALAPPPLDFTRSGQRRAIARRTAGRALREVATRRSATRSRCLSEQWRPPGGHLLEQRDVQLPARRACGRTRRAAGGPPAGRRARDRGSRRAPARRTGCPRDLRRVGSVGRMAEISLHGHTVTYREAGTHSGGPVLVLLHGIAGCGRPGTRSCRGSASASR